MIQILNIVAGVLTIGMGLIAFLSPTWAAGALDLKTDGSTMGLSELRASAGGLFVVTAAAAIWLNQPLSWAMLGFIYAGAAAGRAVSILVDHPPLGKALAFGGIEVALAAWLIVANLNLVKG